MEERRVERERERECNHHVWLGSTHFNYSTFQWACACTLMYGKPFFLAFCGNMLWVLYGATGCDANGSRVLDGAGVGSDLYQ